MELTRFLKTIAFFVLLILSGPVFAQEEMYFSSFQNNKSEIAEPKLTAEEREFLLKIPQLAVSVVDKNIETLEYQLDCLRKDCADAQQIKAAVKFSYQQYKTYYVLANMGYYYKYGNHRMKQDLFSKNLTISTPYSEQSFKIDPNLQGQLMEQYKDDRSSEYIRSQKNCKSFRENINDFYQKQLGQIMSLVPVVLFIKSDKNEIEPQEYIAAYSKLLESLEKTKQNFSKLLKSKNDDELIGLLGYKKLVRDLMRKDPSNSTKILSALQKKISYKTIISRATSWVNRTMPLINWAFLGCAIVGAATVNPAISFLCMAGIAAHAGFEVYHSYKESEEAYENWVAQVGTFKRVEEDRKKYNVSKVLFALNIAFAGMAGAELITINEIRSLSYHINSLRQATSLRVLEEDLGGFFKEILSHQAKENGPLLPANLWGAIYTSAKILNDEESSVTISQSVAEIMLNFNKKGYYSYSDSVKSYCMAENR